MVQLLGEAGGPAGGTLAAPIWPTCNRRSHLAGCLCYAGQRWFSASTRWTTAVLSRHSEGHSSGWRLVLPAPSPPPLERVRSGPSCGGQARRPTCKVSQGGKGIEFIRLDSCHSARTGAAVSSAAPGKSGCVGTIFLLALVGMSLRAAARLPSNPTVLQVGSAPSGHACDNQRAHFAARIRIHQAPTAR